jgi:hypothetical protein
MREIRSRWVMKPVRLWVASVVLAGSGVAHGQTAQTGQTHFGIEVGAGYSDNITRVETNKESSELATIGLDLSWAEQTRRIDASATADLSYFEYLDNIYDSEVAGIADASVLVTLLPERLTWSFLDSFGQAQTDPFSPITPDNRENINNFSTGPELTLGLGSQNSLRLFGSYASTSYERSLLDADQTSGGVALARNPTSSSEIALNVVTMSTDFDEPSARDYDRENAYLSVGIDGSRTDLEMQLGYSRLTPDGGESEGGLLANILATREVSASSSVRLEVGRQFTNAAESLRTAIVNTSVGGTDITATSDPFENTHASLRWTFTRNRTGFSLGTSWSQDRYEQQIQFDRTRNVFEGSYTRRMSSVTDLSLIALYNQEKFDNTGLDTKELNFSARLNHQLGRTFGIAFSLERSQRRASSNFGEYDENRAFLALTYTPLNGTGSSAR